MPFDGNGNYNPPAPPVFPAVPNTDILASYFNTIILDIASSLSSVLTLDGQKAPTADINFGGFTLTNLGAPTSSTKPIRVVDLQSNTFTNLTNVAGIDAITANASAGLSAYALGQIFQLNPVADNTSAVTLNINSIGAKAITKEGTTPLRAGDIRAGRVAEVYYDGTQFQLVQSPTHSDLFWGLFDSTDPTKEGQFDLNLITTNTKRVLQWPDTSGVIALSAQVQPEKRHTVLYGPTDSDGFPTFGSFGGTVVTVAGSLKVTSAFQDSNLFRTFTNPTFTGLNVNGTAYLWVDVNSGATGFTMIAPNYTYTTNYSNTLDQHTFSIPEMTMKVGTGVTSTQSSRVFIGEATVAGNVVTAVRWYALKRSYRSVPAVMPGAGSNTTHSHNLGVNVGIQLEAKIINISSSTGYPLGSEATLKAYVISNSAAVQYEPVYNENRNTLRLQAGVDGNGWLLLQGSSGVSAPLVPAGWNYFVTATTKW